jgi:hypothetical protein
VNAPSLRPFTRHLLPLCLGLLALVVLGGVAAGLWAERKGPAANPARPAAKAATTKARASPKSVELEYAPGGEPSGLLADAFEAATGHRKGYIATDQEDEVTTRPVRVVQLLSGYALITETTDETHCHACLGILAIHYFKKESGRILIAGEPLQVGDKWGEPPRWRLTNAFTTSPALLVSVHDHGQGVYTDDGWLIELAPSGPAVSDEITTSHEDEGAPDPNGRRACTVKGRIVNIRKDEGFDVRVTGSINAVDRYRRKNGKFVATSPIYGAEHCGPKGVPR